MERVQSRSEPTIERIQSVVKDFFIYLRAAIDSKLIGYEFFLTGGHVNYGEISSEWHEGSPDWAFGPPNK